MTKIRKFSVLLLLLGTGLVCGQPGAQSVGLVERTVGNISYVSGGVGASEQEELERIKQEYNLRLLFAVSGSGSFLASVPLKIADGRGQVLLEAVSAGPYFYARVPAGLYQVSAERHGQVKTQSVRIPATGAASVNFRWAAN